MESSKVFISKDCVGLVQNFSHLNNCKCTASSYALVMDYEYAEDTYEKLKKVYIESVINHLNNLGGQYSLVLVSNLLENRPLYHKKSVLTNSIEPGQNNSFHVFELEKYMVQFAMVHLTTNISWIRALELLYAGYESNSFIVKANKGGNFAKNPFVLERNKHGQGIRIKADCSIVK